MKIFKWLGKFLGIIILLLVLAGLSYRLFSSGPTAPGKLVDVNGTKLHIRAEGEKNELPTLILESGAGGDTEMFHWIAENLKNEVRIIRYDREGKGFSEETEENITPEFYAKQLHQLLEKNGEKPPYILVGHSMGGPYNRIFRDLYPNEVKGMIFLDASHPEQWKRLAQKELYDKNKASFLKGVSFLGDIGLTGLYSQISSFKPKEDDLPEDCQKRNRELTAHSGKVYRRFLKEMAINDTILYRAGQSRDLDSLPVLVFTATEQYREAQKKKYRKEGIDPEKQVQIWFEMQKELKELSSNSEQFIMESNHGSIITKKENADKISKKILLMAEEIK